MKIIDGNKLYHTIYDNNSKLKDKISPSISIKIEKYKSLYYLKLTPNELIVELILFLYINNTEFPFNLFIPDSSPRKQELFKRTFRSKDYQKKNE